MAGAAVSLGEPKLDQATAPLELTILMPCLNEAETLATCIQKALGYLARSGVSGEVLIADNGSTDGSQEIARGLGARVIDVPEKGYGAALIAGIAGARGRYVIMGDSDDSYDFSALDPFIAKLRDGYDLVMGNRFKGGIAPGAMSARTGDGIRLGNGGESHHARASHYGSADHAFPRWQVAPAAFAILARWLAAFAVFADLLPALAVPVSWRRTVCARRSGHGGAARRTRALRRHYA